MKTLKIIAAFILLATTGIGSVFAYSRGARNFERFPRIAARAGAFQNDFDRANFAPDAPDSFGKLARLSARAAESSAFCRRTRKSGI